MLSNSQCVQVARKKESSVWNFIEPQWFNIKYKPLSKRLISYCKLSFKLGNSCDVWRTEPEAKMDEVVFNFYFIILYYWLTSKQCFLLASRKNRQEDSCSLQNFSVKLPLEIVKMARWLASQTVLCVLVFFRRRRHAWRGAGREAADMHGIRHAFRHYLLEDPIRLCASYR